MLRFPALTVKGSASSADVDLVVVHQKGKDQAQPVKGVYGGVVEKLSQSKTFSGAYRSTQFVRFGGKGQSEHLLLVGAGAESEATEEKFRMMGGSAWAKLEAEKCGSVSISADQFPETEQGLTWLRGLLEGLMLGSYKFTKYKSSKKEQEFQGPAKITVWTKDSKWLSDLQKQAKDISDTVEIVTVVRDWSNEPSNEGTPEYFAKEAQKLAKEYGLKCTVLTEAEARREKMGLLLSVSAGSDRECRVVTLEYSPGGQTQKGRSSASSSSGKTLCLVGKGVTFDSGGISIKPSGKMEEMKHDMTGAATVMGAILLAARRKVKNRVVAVMGFTENMPSGKATQPGNVIAGRSGKTVEIWNTDAEGRLVLADILDYAKKFSPDAIVDVATLTGAVLHGLGTICTAVLGNSEDLIGRVRKAGNETGEKIWPLPLYEEYFEDMKSVIADMKNISSAPNAGTIRGAIFLKQFVDDKTPWAHLDIAGTAWDTGHLSYCPKKGASGVCVRTLARLAEVF